MKKIALMSLVASSVLIAGGYKIPEVSLNSIALSSANIAHNKSADAAYYNPANMVFMSNENHIQADLTYIGLDAPNYKSNDSTIDIDAKSENFLVPALNYVSEDMNGARFGLSVVVPGGLSKRWNDNPAKQSAEEFTLETVEINPTVALPIGDKIGVAVGLRVVHSSGVVKATPMADNIYQDMEGDSIDFGYNLALAYKPTSELELGVTYRSKVDLTEDGDAEVYVSSAAATVLSLPFNIDPARTVDASVTVPLPAALSLAVAYTLPTKTTLEFVYERNYWSSYEEINFNFADPYAEGVFGSSTPKDWEDTNAFRLGVTQEYDKMTLMAGLVIDETPVPDTTVGFELPDSDSVSVSLGGRYQIDKKMDVGLAALYSMRDERKVDNAHLSGEFTNSDVLLVSVGMGYKF